MIDNLPESLKKYAKSERQRICKEGKLHWFKMNMLNLYLPSFSAFGFSATGVALLYLLTSLIPQTCIDSELLKREDLLAAHAGIGAVVFALFIFIAESLRDGNSKDRGRVLLKISFLYPLVIFETAVFILLLIFNFKLSNLVAVLFVAGMIIYSIHRVIVVSLDNSKFFQKRVELWKESLGRHVHHSVEDRIKTNTFLSALESNRIKLKHNPFLKPKNKDIDHIFFAPKSGRITDINLRKLKEASDIIDNEAKKNGFIFDETELTPNDIEYRKIEDTLPKELKPPTVNDSRYIHFGIGDSVIRAAKPIMSFPKVLISDDSILDRIRSKMEEAITITNDKSEGNAVRKETSWLRQEMFKFVESNEIESFKELQKIYVGLAEGFIENMINCGNRHDHNKAQQERTQIFTNWSELKWIREDLLDLINQVLKRNADDEIWQIVADTPFDLIAIGIRHNDQLLFQEGLSLFTYFTHQSLKNNKPEDAKKLVTYFSSFFKYQFEDLLEETAATVGGVQLFDFQKFPLFVLSTLLKSAIDFREKGVAFEIIKAIKEIFEKRNDHEDEDYPFSNSTGVSLKEDSLNLRLLELKFGLCAWTSRIQEDDSTKAQILKEIYLKLRQSLPSSIEGFTELFLHVDDDKIASFWQWIFWGREDNDSGVIWTIPRDMIKRYFVYRASEILKNQKSPISYTITDEDHIHTLSIYSTSDSIMKPYIDELKDAPKNFFDTDLTSGAEKLKEYLGVYNEKWTEIVTTKKQTQNISQSKVTEFIDSFQEGFNSTVVFRSIFSHFNKFKLDLSDTSQTTEEKANAGTFGIVQIDTKAAFFENWHSSYGKWGHTYGTSMAQGEDNHLLSELINGLNTVEVEKSEAYKILENYEYSENSVIFASRSLFRVMRNFEHFRFSRTITEGEKVPKNHLIGFIVKGTLQIPIYTVVKDQSILVIYDFKNSGEITVLNAHPSEELTKKTELNGFYYAITEYSQNQALLEQILNTPPEWLKKYGDREKQKLYLLESVVIEILERIEIKNLDRNVGRCLKLKSIK